MRLIVTIPAHNEAKTIGKVVSGALAPIEAFDEIEVWVINDGSTDATAEIAREAGASVICLQHRMGLGNVFAVGLQQARRRCADVMVNIDGDGQFDPADIPRLIQPILDRRADFVTCTRFGPGRDRPKMSGVKYWGNQVVVGLINRLCGYGAKFTDVSCGFRAFNQEAICRLTLFGKFTYTQEVFMDLFRKNLRIEEVPLQVRGEREFGRSRIASSVMRYGVHSGMIMLRAVRDIKPLKFFGSLSGLFFAVSLLTGGFLAVWYLLSNRTSPFTSLVTISGVALILSFVLLTVGMIADMISRHRQITEELLYLTRRNLYQAPEDQRSETQRVIASTLSNDAPRSLSPMVPEGLKVPAPRRVTASHVSSNVSLLQPTDVAT